MSGPAHPLQRESVTLINKLYRSDLIAQQHKTEEGWDHRDNGVARYRE